LEIIGEKINGTRKRVARAIAERDADFVRNSRGAFYRRLEQHLLWATGPFLHRPGLLDPGPGRLSQLYAGLPGRTVQRIGHKGRLRVGTGPLD
jgi:hypothetical protein